jgi:hypothetical protein
MQSVVDSRGFSLVCTRSWWLLINTLPYGIGGTRICIFQIFAETFFLYSKPFLRSTEV